MTETSGTSVVRLGLEPSDKRFLYLVGPALGVAAAVAVPRAARWAHEHDWPVPALLHFLSSLDSSWLTWGAPLIGALVGLLGAVALVFASPVLYVSADGVQVERSGATRHIHRAQVAGVYRDGGKLVIESAEGRTLYKGDAEGGRETVRAAFVDHGYPWEAE